MKFVGTQFLLFDFYISEKSHWQLIIMRITIKEMNIMLALVLMLQIILRTASTFPVDGGYGGVYDSPEANEYWARRLGPGFLKSPTVKYFNVRSKSADGTVPSTPTVRLDESFRNKSYKSLKDQNTIDSSKVYNKSESFKRNNNSFNRPIKVDGNSSSSLKKKYLKKYFAGKKQSLPISFIG